MSILLITNSTNNINKYKTEECSNTLFEYDLIEYYNIDSADFNDDILNHKDTVKRKILNDYFTDINDSISLKHINKYYKKRELNKRTSKFIKSYICKKKINLNNEFSECLPIFRDILILKKQTKIVGIIKICFECNLSNIISSKYNSYTFNVEELEILEKFLIENNDVAKNTVHNCDNCHTTNPF